METLDWNQLRAFAATAECGSLSAAARRLGLLWGAHAVPTKDIGSFEEMIAKGKRMALRHGIGKAGAKLVMMAGVPFGTPGSTNVLHVATLTGDELRGYS